jgi:TolA-binding protein
MKHVLKVKLQILTTLALLLFPMLHGWAGEITLVVENTTRVVDHRIDSEFKITNKGTDIAWNVSLQSVFLDQQQLVSVGEQISPGASKAIKLEFDLPPEVRGDFPIFSMVTYQDQTGTFFSNAILATAHTSDASQANLAMNVTRNTDVQGSPIRVELTDPESSLTEIMLTCHAPDDLTVTERVQQVEFKNGKAATVFPIKNRKGTPGSTYNVFIIAEYDRKGIHSLVYSSIAVPVETLSVAKKSSVLSRYKNPVAISLLILGSVVTALLSIRKRKRVQRTFEKKAWLRLILNLLILLVIEIYILSKLSPQYLLTNTITTGGDTASHYYTLEYLRHELLPHGKIGGWTPGNYAGFPILQLYFPLPFLIMCALDVIMPLQVAFKWGTLLGTLLLPIAAYSMLRSLRCPFPGPAIGAALTLPFLFNTANSMWGGNILSTLAGEFAYSLSLSLSLILLGSLYRGCTENRYVIRNAVLVFLVGFSHGYTLLFVEAVSLFFLITPRGFIKRLMYLFKVYALGFLFLAFWLVPLIVFTKYTTPYHVAWVIYSIKEVIPDILLPLFILAGCSSIGLFVWKVKRRNSKLETRNSKLETHSHPPTPLKGGMTSPCRPLGFLWFGVLVAGVMFVTAPKLGVVDIRYVPFGQLMICLIAALGLGWLGTTLNRWGLSWIYLVLIVGATLAWTNNRATLVPEWTKWNYEGFEAKPAWSLFRKINESLKGSFQDPRVVYEHSSLHNMFGSTRAFESLPLFSGRATLEGVYMQASLSSPFVFYIQSEISKEQSCPFRQYNCATMNFGSARRHLEMFNVRELILRSQQAKAAIRSHPEYHLHQTLEDYEIWELTSYQHRYVVPLSYEPIPYSGQDWRTATYQWFIRDDISDVHLTLITTPSLKETILFKTSAESLNDLEKIPIDTDTCRIRETIQNDEILIETNWINKPLLIKVSYHPNWHVEGADKIYPASPSFMLIFPNQENVRLYYGSGLPDRIGMILTGLGIIILVLNIPLPWRKRIVDSRENGSPPLVGGVREGGTEPSDISEHSDTLSPPPNLPHQGGGTLTSTALTTPPAPPQGGKEPTPGPSQEGMEHPPGPPQGETKTIWSLIAKRFGIPETLEPRLTWDPSAFIRRSMLIGALIISTLIILWGSYHIYTNDPHRWFNAGVKLKDATRFDEAREKFRNVLEKASPVSGLAEDSSYYIAICYYLQNDNSAAIAAFQELIEKHPNSLRIPEAYYHIGLCYFRMRKEQEGIAQMRFVTEKYPNSIWAVYAEDRLREHHALDDEMPLLTEENINQHMNQAIHLFNQDRLNEARPIFQEISDRYPEFEGAPQALACLALIFYKQGDCYGTIRHYQELIERYPQDRLVPEAYYHLGICYEKTGKKELAKEAYQIVSIQYPETIYGKQAAEKLKNFGSP